MKITSFNPFIAAINPDGTVNFFQELGFQRRHTKTGIKIADREDTAIRMKDANGFYIDVLQPKSEQKGDIEGIRMNVDNFDEAYQLLQERGCVNIYGDETVQTKSSKAAILKAPTGFLICVIQHLKEEH